MKTSGNTILITGGGSGIGRALAHSFHALGNSVIVAGRRQAALDETCAGHPGMVALAFDVEHAAALRAFAARVVAEHPDLNVLINNAGIMRTESLLSQPDDLADAEAMVAINLLGPIRLTAALLPHLAARPSAAIINVTSGLAYLPRADYPTYCATKAAIHAYTQALRYQLRASAVDVLELVPPYVQTELNGPAQAVDPNAMPLAEFIAETMSILVNQPDQTEICVERVKPLRFAAVGGGYDGLFKSFNDRMSAASRP